MKELIYRVNFLSDIVFPASSNTEGNIEKLDFIPGSNFLGMVAKNYGDFENSFAIFHSGKVRFGDATVLKDEKETYKMPLSYFHEKLDKKLLYNHHKIDDFSQFNQLKQLRSGYITDDLEVVNIEYNYAQKSAYDKEKRRSKDSSMFGYSAIKSGTIWQFSIKVDAEVSAHDLELLKSSIVGKKRLGKSKSAEYGLVKIEFIKELDKFENIQNSNEIVLYAKSRLALIDECGNPTYDLKYFCSDLKDTNIDYSKTQIKTSTFTPYNTKRQTKDYERVCINKGSVIVLNNLKDEQIEEIKNGVGAYLSEGFGEVLINPEFLDKNGFEFIKEDSKDNSPNKKKPINSELARFLRQREDDKKEKLNLLSEVEKFIEDKKNLKNKKMNSQWGKIRSICSTSTNDTIYANVKEYITHGVAKTKWEGENETLLLNAIKNNQEPLEFTKLISMLIPKKREEQKDD